jgi:hypothetical protein
MSGPVATVPDHITVTLAAAADSAPWWPAIFHNPTFIGVVVTGVLGLFGVWVANVITGNLKDQELFLKACEFLNTAGGTKSRALGIGVLKNYAERGFKKMSERKLLQ